MNLSKSHIRTSCVCIAMSWLLISVCCNTGSSCLADHYTTWKQYGGGPDQSKFFAASQITRENVGKMELAWVYPTTDSMSYFFSPIVVDTIMYVLGKNFSLIAIHALTG